ncbi:hypothetical protein J3Q64DRAFT_1700783 [Phycomyces blakesleeanus]|uniref:F-box domain-containing protein n=1 Tax=Phycomyces blakesleeanus TaxID=4837 RepID=A0ABR3AUM4_PHYBL
MAFELPIEILSKVAEFLSPKDKSRCIAVCKSWYTPFNMALWNYTTIFNQKKLKAMCDINSIEGSTYQKNGQYVRHLYLDRHTDASNHQLRVLQQLFQNINRLDISYFHLRKAGFSQTEYSNPWKALSELEIYLDFSEENITRGFLDVLSDLSRLKRLVCSSHFQELDTWAVKFGPKDIDTLHTKLPRLTHLSLHTELRILSEKELETINNTIPAANITKLVVTCKVMDYRWLCYFARKYPKVETLRWNPNEEDENQRNKYNEAVLMFESLPYAFPRLKRLKISQGVENEQGYLVIWELLRPFGTHINHLSYKLAHSLDEVKVLSKILKSFTLLCFSTLETLCLRITSHSEKTSNLFDSFNCYPSLTDLKIQLYGTYVALDILLDRCAVPKRLKIQGGEMSGTLKDSVNVAPHGLRIIEFTNMKLDSATFQYISYRCRNLNYMKLDKICIYGGSAGKSNNLFIDMAHTHFKALILNRISFRLSYNYDGFKDSINLLVLSYPLEYFDPNISKPANIDISNKTQHTIKSIWIHLSWSYTYPWRWKQDFRILGKKDADQIHQFFYPFDFKPFSKVYGNNRQLPDDYLYQDHSTNFSVKSHLDNKIREDLCRGHTSLDFRQIDKYSIGIKANDTKYFRGDIKCLVLD